MDSHGQGDNDGSSGSSNTCPICIGPFHIDSYLDKCFHKFCRNCILRWSEVVAGRHSKPPSSVKCPLCKTENTSIIHGTSFQKHYFNQDVGSSAFFSDAHKYRLQCYYIEPGTLTDTFSVSLYWKSNKYVQKNRFLFNWLRRELQALFQKEDVDIIAHHLHGSIDSLGSSKTKAPGDSPGTKQEEFKALVSQAAEPFLRGRTSRFVEELELFLASGLTIEAYDKVYIQHLGWKYDELTPDDDDVIPESTPVVPSLSLFNDDDFE
ncbi:E3 ubiquitin-protein ligase Topor [Heracleum sosnowskyi]|uniref:E3 ubiquitin-protein ligase Topor n=1 Tax=Heracleum sosnowskyi TaxID=360622 RepID=A0AAD8JBN7_9APIA|nr:E3 ubiquitin-protein ligase Topor [Heracleum sosnowskyi]